MELKRCQYTITQAVSELGVATCNKAVWTMITEHHTLAARFERNMWIIPAAEIRRLDSGLPLDEERRRQIMGRWLDADGNVNLPRPRRSAEVTA